MREKRLRVQDNDWIRTPSYSPFDFDIKPTYRRNPMYDIDIENLGTRGERSHPVPKYAGLSGHRKPVKKTVRKPVKKTVRKPVKKSTSFYVSPVDRERLIGVGLLMGLGYVIFSQLK